MMDMGIVSVLLLIVALIAGFVAKIFARKQVTKLKKIQDELGTIQKQVEEFNLFKNSFLCLFTPDVNALLVELTKHTQSLQNAHTPEEQRKLSLCIDSVSERLQSIMNFITQLPNIDDDTSIRKRIKDQIMSKPWHREYLS